MVMQVGPRTFDRTRSAGWSVRVFGTDQVEYQALVLAIPVVVGIIVGMAFGIGPLTALATLGALIAAVVFPYAGVAILAFMAPLVAPSVVPTPGFGIVLVAAILLGCVYRLPIDRPQLRLGAPLLLLLGFILYVTVQQLPEMAAGYASPADHDVGYLYLQLLAGFGAIIAALWVIDGRTPIPVLGMAIAGAVMSAIVAVGPYVAPATAGWFAPLSGQTEDLARAIGTFSNPNFMGVSAAISLTATLGLLAGAESRRVRGLLLGAAVILAGAVLLSLSRGALVTAFAGLFGVAIARGWKAALTVAIAGLLGALVVYPAFVDWRLTALTGSASEAAFQATIKSDAGRLVGALAGISLFLSSPLVGVGFGHYLAETVRVTGGQVAVGAHNWYTYVLGEQGVVGTALWLSLFVFVIARVNKLPTRPRAVGIPVLVAFATASLFLELPTSFQTFAIPAIVVVSVLVGRWPTTTATATATAAPSGPVRPSLGHS
jgi:O-antigen ligase